MQKRNAFTMVEILVISILLGAGLLTILQAINHAKLVNQRIVQTTIANQLATEGAEILYQIRNTNFLKYESDKEIYIENKIKTCSANSGRDENTCRKEYYDTYLNDYKNGHNINNCWLSLNYIECTGTNINILNTGYYYITNYNGINSIKECTGRYSEPDDSECLNNPEYCCYKYRDEYAICLHDGVREPCPNTNNTDDDSKDGKFYRYIDGKGIFNLQTDTTGGNLLGKNDLENATAQEFRFCSFVTRKGGQNGDVEICSTMTNFIE